MAGHHWQWSVNVGRSQPWLELRSLVLGIFHFMGGTALLHPFASFEFGWFWPLLGLDTYPDGPGSSRDAVFWPEHPEQTLPGQFHPIFGFPKKGGHDKSADFR